jgi:UPF0716 family protein affecting phage T7 exclusion
MSLAHTDRHATSGQPPLPLSRQWGPAAGAQIQTSPGASALAAPHQDLRATLTRRARAEWLGFLETGVMLGGVAGLIGGLYLLATSPLPGVVTMLASMTLLLSSVGKLGAEQEARQRCEVTQVSAHRTRANLGHRSGLDR